MNTGMDPSVLKLGIKYDLGSECTFRKDSRLFWYPAGRQNEPQSLDKMNHNLWASAPEGQRNEPVPNKPLRKQN